MVLADVLVNISDHMDLQSWVFCFNLQNVIQTTVDSTYQPGTGHNMHLPYKPPMGQDNYIDPRRPLDQVTCFKVWFIKVQYSAEVFSASLIQYPNKIYIYMYISHPAVEDPENFRGWMQSKFEPFLQKGGGG